MKKAMFKKVDYIIISLVTVIAVALVGVYAIASKRGDYVSVKVSGKEVATFRLSEDTEYVINGYHNGHNTLVIKNKKALWKKQGNISHIGESLICLPNKVVVQIMSDNKQADVDAVVK